MKLKDLSVYIKDKSNAFLSLNNAFTTPEKTPKQAGLQLNDGETYADGKQLELDENSGFFKISSEGIGLVTILLEEGIVEEKTYLNTPPEGTVIKAPGLVTGSVEVVATKVTDLTTLATGVYDLATDKEARSDAYKGLLKIKESIGNDATTFIPILADVLLSAFSGNTTEDWKSLKDSKTDEGKKSHLFTRGAENTVISGVAGVAFVKELPELAEKVSEKIGKVKNIINSLKRFDIEGEFAKGKNLVENTIVWGSKNFKMKWERIGNKISFGDRSDLAKILGTTDNIEAHHIMPWKVCEDNEIIQLAALDGFHPNLVENGLGLEKYSKLIGEGLHGNHPAYDAYLRDRLAKYASKNPNITPEQANKFLQVELIPEMKTYISNAKQSNLNLNEYFKQVVNKNTGIKGY